MKGQGDVGEVLLTVIKIAIFVLIVLYFYGQSILQDTLKMLSKISAEAVARDIGGLLTISGAEPAYIKINYKPEGDATYNLEIKDKIVNVETNKIEEKPCTETIIVEKFCQGDAKELPEISASLEDIKKFTITKTTDITKIKNSVEIIGE